ncbi:RBBP9/YdeN family alpha/beta hydrolase [Comamonas guangdongensis]|uniref:RBBP9/YdeN family alpha/beta hydrolase n=1 Tax=Comamonas guangdongensis TaxID=510515 RepID=A0ABV4A0L7_9BURK
MHSSPFPADITFLIVPGLRDHVEEHWQTHLQKQLQARQLRVASVPPLERDKLSRAARVQALGDTLAAIEGKVVIVAHSAGCITTVHWAQQHSGRIVGALLATPADVERPMPAGYPSLEQLEQGGWCPVPRRPLPFPTIVAASRNDALAGFERAEQMARDWGARLVDLGEVGHLNPAAGFGSWGGAEALLHDLL